MIEYLLKNPVANEQDQWLRAQKAPMTGSDYISRTMARESAGNVRAKNPNSSATGLFQFTRGTWDNYMRKYPELGLTKDGIYDPAQQHRAMQAYTNDTKAAYSQLGIAPTDQNLYAGHFLGQAGGVRFLTNTAKNPMAPATEFVDPQSVAANKTIFYHKDGRPKAAYEVYGNFGSKHGGWTPDFGKGQQSYSNAPQQPSMSYQQPQGSMSMPPSAQPLAPLPTTVIPTEKPIVDPQQAMTPPMQTQQPQPQPYQYEDQRSEDNAWSPRVAASGNGRGFFSLFS
jgi:hypothetical protein